MEDEAVAIWVDLALERVKPGALVDLQTPGNSKQMTVAQVIFAQNVKRAEQPHVTLVFEKKEFEDAKAVTGFPEDRVRVRMSFS